MTETYDKENHWYGWNGGECPVHPDTRVEVCFQHGSGPEMLADQWEWAHDGTATEDIIAFRIIKLYREPRKAREWWLTVCEEDGWSAFYESKRLAEEHAVDSGPDTEIVHVREVLEPSDDN
jgi:hypothetical protein